MHLKSVIFDLDGVILDSFREGLRRIRIIASFNELTFDRAVRQKLTQMWGLPGAVLLERAFDTNQTLSEAMYKQWERMDTDDPVQLIPGTRDALVWLRRNSFVKCLLTSRNRQNVLDVLDRVDLIREFDIIATKTDSPFHKPDPRVFNYTLSELSERGISREECIFVGDTPSDILAGQDASIKTLVVQTGPYLLKHATEYPIPLGDILQSIDDLPFWIDEHYPGELHSPAPLTSSRA